MTAALKKSPPLHTIALVTSKEQEAIGARTAFNLVAFLDFCFKLDQSRSSMRS